MIETIGVVVLGAIGGVAGLLGWSHKNLRYRIQDMEIEVYKKPSRSEMRTLMTDKIRPMEVEYHSLSRRMDELKEEHHKMSAKIDKLLMICSKLVDDKKD